MLKKLGSELCKDLRKNFQEGETSIYTGLEVEIHLFSSTEAGRSLLLE